MKSKPKSLGLGSLVALLVANALVYAAGPAAASGAGRDCEAQECRCNGGQCLETQIGFDFCEKGFVSVPGHGVILDPIVDEEGYTGGSCSDGS